jgi:hypothetical protein
MLSEHLLHEDEPWYLAAMIALSVSGTRPLVRANGYWLGTPRKVCCLELQHSIGSTFTFHSLQRRSGSHPQPSLFWLNGRHCSCVESSDRYMSAYINRSHLPRWPPRPFALVPRLRRRRLYLTHMGPRVRGATAHTRCAHRGNNMLPT